MNYHVMPTEKITELKNLVSEIEKYEIKCHDYTLTLDDADKLFKTRERIYELIKTL